MVKVLLRGGLGNQMFQLAMGLNLARKNGSRLTLDSTYLNDRLPRRNFTHRTFELNVFRLPYEITSLSRVSRAIPIPGVWLGVDFLHLKVSELLRGQKIVRETSCRFDPCALEARGNIFLYGFWQSEKYFADVAEEVRRAFQFKQPLEAGSARLAEKIATANSVSVHVRRGDYAAFETMRRIVGDTNLGYYQRGLAHIAERIENLHFFVFSDDIKWCQQNLELRFPSTYVLPSDTGGKASIDLELMSLCRHNIIANSTFSWWGAWLNSNLRKIVVAPARWYVKEGLSDEDIVPPSWTKL